MKGLVKRHQKEGLWLENDVPMPEMKDDEVLIKTRKTSICGTDIHIYKWDQWAQKTLPGPIVIGHEFVGDIVDMGKNVKDIKIGTRVVGEGHITCGDCPNCRKGKKHVCMNVKGLGYHCMGCFSEYFTLPAENVFILPDSIEDSVAAIFDPYGNAVHTALQFELIGEDILITGAGPIGIMGAAIAKKAGARNIVITDINDYRLDLARQMGATAAINVTKTSIKQAMQELGIPHGFTVGMEMSGNPQAFSSMIDVMQHGSGIALLGIFPSDCSIDWAKVVFNMLTIKGVYGREIFSTWYKMSHLIKSGLDLSPLITHHYPYEEFETAFATAMAGHSGKIILDW